MEIITPTSGEVKRTLLGTLAAGNAMFWIGVLLSSLAVAKQFPAASTAYAYPLFCLSIAGFAMSLAMLFLDRWNA